MGSELCIAKTPSVLPKLNHDNPMRRQALVTPFYRWSTRGAEREVAIQAIWHQSPCGRDPGTWRKPSAPPHGPPPALAHGFLLSSLVLSPY